mmetsp:Transcript_51346/g.120601  ORF Transcript_51346/g.120601 Transcript_51346/m.120601 type:complete len:131 (+) Transcript_51346:189-581(+)
MATGKQPAFAVIDLVNGEQPAAPARKRDSAGPATAIDLMGGDCSAAHKRPIDLDAPHARAPLPGVRSRGGASSGGGQRLSGSAMIDLDTPLAGGSGPRALRGGASSSGGKGPVTVDLRQEGVGGGPGSIR